MALMWRRFLCFIGWHEWDGHTEKEYPAPQCKHCHRFHHHDMFNHNIYASEEIYRQAVDTEYTKMIEPQLDAAITFRDKDVLSTVWTGICVGFDGDKVKIKIPLWGPHGFDDAVIDRSQIIDVQPWHGTRP